MGSNVSKLGRSSGRKLQEKVVQLETNNLKSKFPPSTRPNVEDRVNASEPIRDSSQETIADRLKKLGPLSERTVQKDYKPPSEDKFTITLEARQKLEADNSTELEQGGQRKLIPASTITAILTALKEKDPLDRIEKSFNLHPSVLPKLRALSLPVIPKSKAANELLHNSNIAQKQPVRKTRN